MIAELHMIVTSQQLRKSLLPKINKKTVMSPELLKFKIRPLMLPAPLEIKQLKLELNRLEEKFQHQKIQEDGNWFQLVLDMLLHNTDM